MNTDKVRKIIAGLLVFALFALSQYTIGLERKYEILERQIRLFNDQVYDDFLSGCQGGVNEAKLTIMTHMPDETEQFCRSNAKHTLDSFKQSQRDSK